MASSLNVPQFVKHLDCIDCSVDELPIPSNFSSRFCHRVSDSFKLKFRNAYKIRLTFDRDESEFDLNSFELLIFTFDNVKEFDVTCFDGRNVELVFHTYTIRSGALLQAIRPPSFFAVVVHPFHMLEYCHVVVVPQSSSSISYSLVTLAGSSERMSHIVVSRWW
ncbi:hypothetical protein DCAR_0414572 [Daucus carota subsp. sativus]|uniref:Uncharacterized protein n=1 Tax=Daucus carota subsp. sativus TaxID=79200 RepID=A0A175YC44_DAUCS|nr:hypothetical protein DCAR_0414572 [Daucus carota subsp. sativus]